MRTRMHEETGMMGKLVIVWALLFALVGVAAVDTVSIVFTTFHLSDVAAKAANEGVDAYGRTGNATRGLRRSRGRGRTPRTTRSSSPRPASAP